MKRYLWMSLVSVAIACGPESASDTDSGSDSDSSSDTQAPGDLEVIRGIYDVQISAVDEGCDAPRYTGPDQEAVTMTADGFRLPLMWGPDSFGTYVVAAHEFKAIAGEPGRYAPAAHIVSGEGECGGWRGELGDIELVEAGRISVEASVNWEPAQACPDAENVPSAACTTVLRYDFELVEACPEGCEVEGTYVAPPVGNNLSCVCP
ncbi:hypothetical protein OV203_09600 [Nannocystis sp. ILAH1]|uniref:hypothetical protein n=1 Tax=unclassified Nannocystis TaxID=2627009 RepID=UPI0022719354|nr:MULTISPECIES: hypothetical protein [unclassified Nannocystis]MCY0987376.1 hypothetical protein [Nannocystis sp. ILAH1]MCY1070829.1 hypothetical protein [Nannocystis sp. RBIL2]